MTVWFRFKFLAGLFYSLCGIILDLFLEKNSSGRREFIFILPVAHTPDKSGQETGCYGDACHKQDQYCTHKFLDFCKSIPTRFPLA
jgi:hypothetical protein